MIVPTLAREWALWRAGARRVAGVDEVGMACLAGPVVAAALVVKPYCRKIPGVRDSKTLSLPQRERLYSQILAGAADVAVGAASVREINQINIRRASHLAMSRALARVRPYDHALIDGLEVREIASEVRFHAEPQFVNRLDSRVDFRRVHHDPCENPGSPTRVGERDHPKDFEVSCQVFFEAPTRLGYFVLHMPLFLVFVNPVFQ